MLKFFQAEIRARKCWIHKLAELFSARLPSPSQAQPTKEETSKAPAQKFPARKISSRKVRGCTTTGTPSEPAPDERPPPCANCMRSQPRPNTRTPALPYSHPTHPPATELERSRRAPFPSQTPQE